MMKFSNCIMELWNYLEDQTNVSYTGEPKSKYDLQSTVPCNFQSAGADETDHEYGTVQTDTFRAYFDSNVKINESMLLRIVGETDTHEIIGKPIKYNHMPQLSHIKVLLHRHQDPINLQKSEKKRRLPVDTGKK